MIKISNLKISKLFSVLFVILLLILSTQSVFGETTDHTGDPEREFNRAPTLTLRYVGDEVVQDNHVVIKENELLKIEVKGSDPDGDLLTFSVLNKPYGANFNKIDDITRKLTWKPGFDQAGVYNNIKFTVSDGKASDSRFITITVNDVTIAPENKPPRIISTPITTATENVLYKYDVDATDPDGDALTYSLTTKPAGMSINANTGLISWTPSSSQIGN